jgi:deazaflavin-dependent oxidoreductase (nitroreductase family)
MGRWERLLMRAAASRAGGWTYLNLWPRIDPWLLKRTGGRLSVSLGQPVLLLVHTGAKSGMRRETPLLFLGDGERIVLTASKAGAAHHPAWYHNLRAHPECEVVAPGGRSGRYVAREASGVERDELWAKVNDLYAGYDVYQERTGGRRIPVVVLERAF